MTTLVDTIDIDVFGKIVRGAVIQLLFLFVPVLFVLVILPYISATYRESAEFLRAKFDVKYRGAKL